jgi:hypothetical protein
VSTTTAILGLLLVGIGAVGGWYGYRRYRQRTVIASVETTDALRVTPGPAEVYGTAVPLEEPFRAPFSRQDCVLAEWEIEEWEASGKHSNWRTEGSGTLTTPFYVEDETDRVLVRPGEATVELSQPQETVEVGVDEEPPKPIRSFIDLDATPGEPDEALIGALDWGTQVGDRKYHQRTLGPGEEVYVHGTATRAGARSFGDPDLEIVESADDGHPDADIFLVSDSTESELINRRSDAVLYLVAGGLAAIAGVGLLVAGAL